MQKTLFRGLALFATAAAAVLAVSGVAEAAPVSAHSAVAGGVDTRDSGPVQVTVGGGACLDLSVSGLLDGGVCVGGGGSMGTSGS